MRIVVVISLVALVACSSEGGRVRKRECEAVLAHLTALERGETDQPMCKYHADCAGDEAAKFERNCTRVLTAAQADCYLLSTSLDDADDCLRRDVFDDELRTGHRAGGKGKTSSPDDPWSGSNDHSPLGEMRRIKDQACACKDKACADAVQERFMAWARDNASTSNDDQLSKLAMEASECMVKAMTDSNGTYNYYGSYDAAPAGATGMAACDEYIGLVDRLSYCSAYPQSSRDAIRDSIEAMRKGWGDPAYMSDYMRESTNESCRMMVESMRQTMSSLGCP